jgi:DNA repair protein RadC
MIVHIPIEHSTVQSPSDTYKIMKIVLENENETDRNKEHFWTLAMNEAKNILNLELVSLGTYNMVHASPADILSIPLQKQAQGIILIHNHPLGSLQPSEEDKNLQT